MEKKCTASGCRRTFRLPETGAARCPHCGKEYPRLIRGAGHFVRVFGSSGDTRLLRGVPLYRALVAPLRPSQILPLLRELEQTPLLLGPYSYARAMAIRAEWEIKGFLAGVTRQGRHPRAKKERPPGQSC